jgi:hypothetical protein
VGAIEETDATVGMEVSTAVKVPLRVFTDAIFVEVFGTVAVSVIVPTMVTVSPIEIVLPLPAKVIVNTSPAKFQVAEVIVPHP